MTEADWDRVVDVNLKGTFFACSRAIPELKKTQGCIINLSSDAGLVGTPETAVYTASKGGVSLLTKALAIELAPHLVRVNAVCPADIMTPMLQYQADTYGGGDPEGYFKRLLASYFAGRQGALHHAGGGRGADLLPGLAAGDADHRRQHLHRLRHLGRLRLLMSVLSDERPAGRHWMSRLPMLLLGAGVLAAALARSRSPAGVAATRPGGDWRHLAQVAGRLTKLTPRAAHGLPARRLGCARVHHRRSQLAHRDQEGGRPRRAGLQPRLDGPDLRGQSGARRDAAACAFDRAHRRQSSAATRQIPPRAAAPAGCRSPSSRPTSQHRFTQSRILTDAGEARSAHRLAHPPLSASSRTGYASNAGKLDALVARCQRARASIRSSLNLPLNLHDRPAPLDAPRGRYRQHCQRRRGRPRHPLGELRCRRSRW